VLSRLDRRPDLARMLLGVVADMAPPSTVLTPGFLGRLFA
jgi:hypothetical protein